MTKKSKKKKASSKETVVNTEVPEGLKKRGIKKAVDDIPEYKRVEGSSAIFTFFRDELMEEFVEMNDFKDD